MNELEHKFFKNRASFRSWLVKNHDKSPGLWMIFYKKHVNIEGIKYIEALEEALCFGWIDSLIRKIDEEQYARKFTPRMNVSKWSDVNKSLVIDLIKRGIMTEAGLQKIDIYLKTGSVDWEPKEIEEKKKQKELLVPEFILEEFSNNEPALINFTNLAQSHKKQYILWITSAKKEETIRRRMQEAIKILKENKKLGLK